MHPRTPPLIIAHRGASADRTQNTLEAFEEAIAQGADMIEFDVRQTADGQLIAIHDDMIAGQRVIDLTHDEAADLLGHTPPTLDEVLRVTKGRIGLNIELKTSGFEASVVEALKDYPRDLGVVITSFQDDVIREVRQLEPEFATGLLVGQKHKAGRVRRYRADLFPRRRLETLGVTYLAPHWSLVRAGIAKRMNGHGGYRSLVWTVNDPKQMEQLMQNPSVAGIITDVPAEALRIRKYIFTV